MTKIGKDLKNNIYIYIILCLSMMPLILNGYSMYIIALFCPFALNFSRYTINSIIVLLFSFCYTFAYVLRGEDLTLSQYIFYLFFPIIIFQTAIVFTTRLKDKRSIILLLALMSICLALPTITVNIIDTFSTGKLINIRREVDYDGNLALSATGYGMMLSLAIGSIGLILIQTETKFDKRIKTALIVVSMFAIFCVIHLVNRTGLFLAGISIVAAALYPPYTGRRLLYSTLIIFAFIFIYLYFLADSAFMDDALQSYLDRNRDGGAINSGSGRFDRWNAAFIQIFTMPLGAENLYINSGKEYAHNLWLDTGIKGGIIAFSIIIIITVRMMTTLRRAIRSKAFTSFEAIYLLLLMMTLLAQCATEPVLESVFQLFLFLIFYWGCLLSLKNYRYGQ